MRLTSFLMHRRRLNHQRTLWYFTDELIDQTRDMLRCPTTTQLEEQEQRRRLDNERSGGEK